MGPGFELEVHHRRGGPDAAVAMVRKREVTTIIESGNHAVVEGVYAGTHTGPLQPRRGKCRPPAAPVRQPVLYQGRPRLLRISGGKLLPAPSVLTGRDAWVARALMPWRRHR